MTDRICDKIKLSEIYDRKGVFTYTGERKRREIVMKKKVVGMLLCCVLVVSLAGCGKKQESAETKGEETTEVGVTEEETTAVDDKTTSSSDALGGVYPGADELVSLPMGACIDGEQVRLVNVEMPLNYVFGALYMSESGEGFESFSNASGGGTLAVALDNDFQNEPYEIADAAMYSPFKDGSRIDFQVSGILVGYDEYKENAQNNEQYSDFNEITVNGKDVFYYVDNGSVVNDGLNVNCRIKDGIFIGATYDGPLMDELGIDQVAQNICNLITVIE